MAVPPPMNGVHFCRQSDLTADVDTDNQPYQLRVCQTSMRRPRNKEGKRIAKNLAEGLSSRCQKSMAIESLLA